MSGIQVPALPTEIGQTVKILAIGGRIRVGHCDQYGTVVRFNRAGRPVIALLNPDNGKPEEVADRWGCAALVDADRKLTYRTIAITQ